MKAIEDGADTLFEIVAYTYANVDRSFWIPAASNVRLHVDHLAQQDKLPEVIFINPSNSEHDGAVSHLLPNVCACGVLGRQFREMERDFE